MNVLLNILGHTYRHPLPLRAPVTEQTRTIAARELAAGHLEDALIVFSQLADESHGSVGDNLARAHLHLHLAQYAQAETFFTLVIERIGDSSKLLEGHIAAGEQSLHSGHFVRAIESFQHARAAVDTLLCAHAGLSVAVARLSSAPSPHAAASPLISLANLGDLLLRMLARTHLASSLADCLRERELRDDLASWATSTTSVENLLIRESEQFAIHAAAAPDHAEVQYRLALISRVLGRLDQAAIALRHVLAVHPHHLTAAARLAATLHDLNQPNAILPTLAVAFALPPNVIQQYAHLASAASDPATFDRTVESVVSSLPPQAANTAKANLAFALNELGLLDDTHAQWREPVTA